MLADEINRASPKTQSALLEVMEEGHVTVDGTTYDVPRPFMVIATMNPIEQAGTYRLPEAQLDRFLMKTSIGYPDAASTEELLLGSRLRDRAELAKPVTTTAQIGELAALAGDVHVDRAVVRYVRELAEASRVQPHVRLGLSARGCLALIRVAKTWAASQGRTAVVPEDIARPRRAGAVPPAAPGRAGAVRRRLGGQRGRRPARRRAPADRPRLSGRLRARRAAPVGRPRDRRSAAPCSCCSARHSLVTRLTGLAEFAAIAWLSGLLLVAGLPFVLLPDPDPRPPAPALDPHRRRRGRRGHACTSPTTARSPCAARSWTCPSATDW